MSQTVDNLAIAGETTDAGAAGNATLRPSQVSVSLVLAGLVLFVSLVASELRAWQWMYRVWMSNPDNSHGLLVPAFAAFLLWARRDLRPAAENPISTFSYCFGIMLIVVAAASSIFGIYCRMMTLEAVAIVPLLAGVTLCYGGWGAVQWTWPSVMFLGFMIPLPQVIGNQLSHVLQRTATLGSTYLLQVLGMPAVSEGNLIFLSEATLGVAEACSGIRMLVSFFALTTAYCLLSDRSLPEKVLISLSAPLIAVAANILRIAATGIAYEYGSARLADLIFHDLAGWLMMPIGLLLLWGELFLLSLVLPLPKLKDE